METLQFDVKKTSDYLKKNGIKPSFQRLKIFERLYKKKDHPTVNLIYLDLIDIIPSLSKTTVYNTINIFLEKGIVRPVSIASQETRYDLVTEHHGHFICTKCNKIYDVDINDIDLKNIEKDGNKVISTSITIKGICKDCNKNN